MTPTCMALRAEVCRRGEAPTCHGCNSEVDRDTCHCGDSLASHAWEYTHGFVPSGCICYTRTVLCDPRDRGVCEARS